MPFNFGGQKRSGAFDTVWPSSSFSCGNFALVLFMLVVVIFMFLLLSFVLIVCILLSLCVS